jgi:hypothetical protein
MLAAIGLRGHKGATDRQPTEPLQMHFIPLDRRFVGFA